MRILQWPVYAKAIIFFVLVFFNAYGAFFVSLYPVHQEAAVLHYLAWMIDVQGAIPYKDVFETAFPGSLLFHLGIGYFFGYDDNAFRLVDVGWLAILMWVTWRIMRRIDPAVAWITALGFGSLYFKAGAAMTLQRDYVGILPVALGMLLVLQNQWRASMRAALLGVCYGIAASMKPHLVVGAPVMFWLLCCYIDKQKPLDLKHLATITALCVNGFIVGFGISILWLWYRGAMPAFIDMLFHYMPLYLDLDGFVNTHQGWQAQLLGYLAVLLSFTLGWRSLVWLAIWQGFVSVRHQTEQKRLLITLTILVVVYAAYPFPANKFYHYHWMPFKYFSMLLAGFLLLPALGKSGESLFRRLFCGLAYLFFIWGVAYPPPGQMKENIEVWLRNGYEKNTSAGDEIGHYLREHALEGDVVQPLDTGGQALRAMLQSRTVMATPYSTYQDLFHHFDDPFIVNMRQFFWQGLTSNRPRYIINTYTTPEMACANGEPCKLEEDVDRLLDEQYKIVAENCAPLRCHYRIYERKAP
jgi:hypothetical protein